MGDADVAFPSGALQLRGTFTTPSAAARATVLILNGSGPLDRDSNLERQRLDIAKAFAAAFAEAQIASFRFDKRGVGASEGDYWTATFEDETADARAALAQTKALAGGPVLVLGHSVGATIAMRLAREVDGCVLLAGAAERGVDVMVWQSQRIADTLPMIMRLYRPRLLKRQMAERAAILAAQPTATTINRRRCNVAWMQEFMAFDPTAALRAITVPVLAITGAKDIQVDPGDLDLIAALVKGSYEQRCPPNLSHLLRDDPLPPGISTYKQQIAMPLSTTLPTAVIDWIERLPASR